jgi:acyl transferase domain-containing protein
MQQPDQDLSNQSGSPPSSKPIAIIGIGCRFPGGIHDLDSFWKLLKDGVDAIGEIPASRFDASAFMIRSLIPLER